MFKNIFNSLISQFTLLFFIFLLISGCNSKIDYNNLIKYEKVNVPEGKWIKINDSLYLIPKGRTKENCEIFITYSKKDKVPFIIYYKTQDNNFTTDKKEAYCEN